MLIDLWNVVENAKLARSVHQILAFDGCWVGASGVQSHFMDQPQQSSDTELSGIPLDLGDPPRSSKAYFDNDDLNLKGYDFSFWFSTTYRIQRYRFLEALASLELGRSLSQSLSQSVTQSVSYRCFREARLDPPRMVCVKQV